MPGAVVENQPFLALPIFEIESSENKDIIIKAIPKMKKLKIIDNGNI